MSATEFGTILDSRRTNRRFARCSDKSERKKMGTSTVENVGAKYPSVNSKTAVKADSDRTPGKKPRILVVEDEIFVAWHLEAVLRDLGHAACGLVPDGESAVARADETHADIILMDINLKGAMDGIEAARRIRETSDATIVFITAYSDQATRARIEKTVPGAQVLAKPVSTSRLRYAIEQALAS